MCESAHLLPVVRLHQAGDAGAVFTNWDRLSISPNDILHSFVPLEAGIAAGKTLHERFLSPFEWRAKIRRIKLLIAVL